jgi:protocatechuate 3,4-dioxygenase beta subunit
MFSHFPFHRQHRRSLVGHGRCDRREREGRSPLSIERLEDRSLLSGNAISGFAFNDLNNNGLLDPGENGLANVPLELRNASDVVIATAVTDANGYYQFKIDNTISTAPAILTRAATVSSTPTDWIKSLSLAQFDPALGTLTSVDIINAGSITSQIKVENLDAAPATITATVAGSLTLSGAGFTSLVTNGSSSKTYNAGAFDGVIDFAGASGHDFGPQTAPGSTSFTVTTSTDLAHFIGTGSIALTEVAHATSAASGAGNLVAQINTTAATQVSVIYHYSPSNSLRPGTYRIVQTSQPAGFLDGKLSTNGSVIPESVGKHSMTVTLSTSDLSHNDFAEIVPASLAGLVYLDTNNNGLLEAGEAGISGTTITLTGTNDLGSVNLSTSTAADGSYQFRNLRPGNYTVTETAPAGYLHGKNAVGSLGGTLVSDHVLGFALGTGVAGTNYNFAELTPSSISGFVYLDANSSGAKEGGEPGIPGVAVTLTGTNDVGPVSLATSTAADGSYQFRNLRPGSYTITETEPAGYLHGKNALGSLGGTLAGDQVFSLGLSTGAAGNNYNFAELTPASLSGFVYLDANNNGIKDPAEAGIGSVIVTLAGVDDKSSVNWTTTTAADGSYQFRNLRPGSYTITQTEPAGYIHGKNALGSPGGTMLSNLVFAVNLAVGVGGMNYNFAELGLNSLAGYVYFDANNNGTKDLGEAGIATVTITLVGTNDQGPLNFTTTTATDGSYQFRSLRPGSYVILEREPAGYLHGKNTLGWPGGTILSDLAIAVNLDVGTAGTNYNFAELNPPGSLSGYVYLDTSAGGTKAPRESGIAGVSVGLTGTTGEGRSVNLSQTTAADGSYRFLNLPSGTYTIIETQPAGYLPGKETVGTVGGLPGDHQFSAIVLTPGAAGMDYNFGHLQPSNPTDMIFADSFGFSADFAHPLDVAVLSKLQFLSFNNTLDPSLVVQASFVDGVYRHVLGRSAEATSLIGWVQRLQIGASRAQVVDAIWNSAEHRGVEVDRLYATFLHRSADAVGRAGWVNAMLAGASEVDVARALIASAEFQAAHADNASYVSALYAAILGRTPSGAEVSGWVTALRSGISRDAVAFAFLNSGESFQLILNCDYTHFLHRAADKAGNQAWQIQLQAGQMTPAVVCKSFLASEEFFALARNASKT